ncbi:MAG: (2Fe-2S)-binding protein [Myxococcota bacterium]|nr:(2Fe-2S)-binding protein [Myxococcota bacterium]
MTKFQLNGKQVVVEADPTKPLLWVLREDLQLTSTKYGCGIGQCGACTVLVNDRAVRSCVTLVGQIDGRNVRTLENLDDRLGASLKNSWVKHSVPQCGFCQSGQILGAYSLLKNEPQVAAEEIPTKLTNICRCGTYKRIHEAVESVAKGEE